MRVLLGIGALAVLAVPATAQMVTGARMPGYAEAFSLSKDSGFTVQELAVTTPSGTMANVLTGTEQPTLTLLVHNSGKAFEGTAYLRVVHYRTSVPAGDVWKPHVYRMDEEPGIPVELHLHGGGEERVTVEPKIPAGYGGYALVLDVPERGRTFAATMARVISPDAGRVQFPTYALDTDWPQNMNEGVYVLMQKLGIKGVRTGAGFNVPGDPEFKTEQARLERELGWAQKHDVTVMLTLGCGAMHSPIQPLGMPRPWLSPEGVMQKTKADIAWMPQFDGAFQKWTEDLATQYGWPKGNLNAVELWNEPWESISISGWGADIPRYREMYAHMAEGVLDARKKEGAQVLIGGTSSSPNAREKLFPDGKNTFLPVFDFVSIHYQGLAADPSLIPEWIHRKGATGPVRVWDTESWIANSEDRVAGVLASMRAQGQSRTAGVYAGNVYESRNVKVGGETFPVVQAYPTAAAIAAAQKFIGQRPFREILFRNGLPWVFVFGGRDGKDDDGTLVVVGDLTKIYPRDRVLFRSVKLSDDASLRLKADASTKLYDFYGNDVKASDGGYTIPLDGHGFFLRGDGSPGSFARVVEAVRKGAMRGVEPVEFKVHDFTAPMEKTPGLRIELTNVLNRPVHGTLSATVAGEQMGVASVGVDLAANETKTVSLPVHGTPVPSNAYAMHARFDAGADGAAEHDEMLHVDWIARRTVHVDGDLKDWDGVLPQVLASEGLGANLTEKAYLPFLPATDDANTKDAAPTVWMAYDDQNFYFAARIVDTTLDEGMVRFASRDDDSYFYPELAKTADGNLVSWPQKVRRYSYRKHFDIPSGSGSHDNVLLAFNVLEKKPWLPYPAGTMPHFISYWDTDYEYALNPVAKQYGGGTELWRLLAPGVPAKSYFPRQPKAAVDQGPVSGAQLVIRREGNLRIVEASIPWAEMPAVHERILAGKTVKFTCRVNDNKGRARELAAERSVSKDNPPTFHDSWQTHWSNELEFGAEK
ncbi:MAG: hypothetical protein PW792_15775 [Acidobacteriaceae bacterium]|nr:hypothetical protein [Acidobacteriaceae bacterium]